MENRSRATGNGELTFGEIGEILGITPQMARVHYHSGMMKLRSRRRTPAIQSLLRLAETKATLR
jgi:DNA-binding CsgD family transcriptional regulator